MSKKIDNGHDFWVGDRVRILASWKIGKVEGDELNGLLKVRLEDSGEYLSVRADELEQAEEERGAMKVEFQEDKTDLQLAANFNPVIDLHLDRLGNFHKGTWKADELSYQKHQCRKFLNEVIRMRVQKVLIIHVRPRNFISLSRNKAGGNIPLDRYCGGMMI